MAYKAMKKSSITAQFFSEQENHDALSFLGITSTGEFDYMLNAMEAAFLVNQTNRNLVVPRNCYYSVNASGSTDIVAPISPKGALLLFKAEKKPEWTDGFAVITGPDIVGIMDIYALQYEHMFSKAFVASNSRFELEYETETPSCTKV